MIKRILFWLLLVVFIAACAVWFLHVPYQPKRLYRLLPEDTVFLSHHRELAERWDDFVENPLAQTMLEGAGLDTDDLLDWTGDPEIRPWLDKFLARDVVIAYVPRLGSTLEPAWVIAGWIGGESVRLRWLLQRGAFREFHAEPRQGGGAYWRLEPQEDEADDHLSISVVEGMLVGVFSADPHAIRHVLDVYDGLAPGYVHLHPNDAFALPDTTGSDAWDQGWFKGFDLDRLRIRYRFALNQVDAIGIKGSVSMPAEGDWPAFRVEDSEPAGRLLGGIPFLTVAAQPDALYSLLQGRLAPLGDQLLQGMYETGPEGVVLGTIQGGDYAGSLFGISVPSLLLTWPVADEEEAIANVRKLLDQLNARWQWGLVASLHPGTQRPVYMIESTANTAYARFRERERLAFTWVDGWLVLASHARPLIRLVERLERPESVIEVEDGGWLPGLRDGGVAAHGYWNIRGGARTLRMAISAYSMRLLFEDRSGSRQTRQQLAAARDWLDLLEAMGEVRLWLDQVDGERMIRFQFGESKENL